MPQTDYLLLRPAVAGDAPRLAEVWWASRWSARPFLPPSVHARPAVATWVAGWDYDTGSVWLAEEAGATVGLVRLVDSWLDDLYVAPGAAGRGVGSALLEVAKVLAPEGFSLWVFESNTPARRFYEHHGLVVTGATDGAGNQERQPDLRMEWVPARPPRDRPSVVSAGPDTLT